MITFSLFTVDLHELDHKSPSSTVMEATYQQKLLRIIRSLSFNDTLNE